MQHMLAICPKCKMKNRIPEDRVVQEGRCGNCHAALDTKSRLPARVFEVAQFLLRHSDNLLALLRNRFGYVRDLACESAQKLYDFAFSKHDSLATSKTWLWVLIWFLIIPTSSFISKNYFKDPRNSSASGSLRPASSPTSHSFIPAYWPHLERLEPLLNNDFVDPFAEKDFLWFIYESDEWLGSHSYLRQEDQDRARKVFIELLAERNEFPEFKKLFLLGEAEKNATEEIRSEKRQLEIQLKADRNQMNFASGFNSGFEGGKLGVAAYSQGAGGKEALIAAAGYTVISAMVELYQNDQKLDAAKRQALDHLAERSRKQLDQIAVKERALRQQLESTVSLEVIGGELKGIVRREVDQATRFAELKINEVLPEDSPRVSIEGAYGLLKLRRRIPRHPMFNRWRAETAFWAAYFLESVAVNESEGKPWGANPSKAAQIAVKVWDLALHSDPDDSAGYIRAHRAYSLALDGHAHDARETAGKWIWNYAGDPGFASLYVRLQVLDGQCGPETIQWLERAIDATPRYKNSRENEALANLWSGTSFIWNTSGRLTVADVVRDPSLARLRETQGSAIAELLRPKYEWRWVDGFMSDEVYLTNRSKFPLTNVSLCVIFHSNAKPHERRFTTNFIGPGTTVCWKNQKIPASASRNDTAHLECDEINVSMKTK